MDKLAPVAIITDTAAGIPETLLDQYRIETLPFWVRMGSISYRDGVDLKPEGFFKMLRAQTEPDVSTSVPAMTVFSAAYEKVAQWAKSIVAIHVAGKQSATYTTATLAAQESPVPTVVLDTGTTAMGQGFVVLEAARAAARGASLNEVVDIAASMLPNVGVFALLESIDYAVQGGRLSSAARMVGSLLRVHPIVRVQSNRVSLMVQTRRRRQGRQTLIDRILAEVKDAPTHLAVHYAEDETEGRNLLSTLMERVHCVESYLTHVPVVLGVHAGPGSIGVAYYVEREAAEEELGLRQRLEELRRQASEAVSEALKRLPRPKF